MTDYKACNAKFKQQKAALTRAQNSKDAGKVFEACKKAVHEWDTAPFNGMWPDAWQRWQMALYDAGYGASLDDLR